MLPPKAKIMIERNPLFRLGYLLLVLIPIGTLSYAQSQEAQGRKLVRKVEPEYPDLAQKLHLKGFVKVELTIATDGSIRNVTVLGGNPVLAQAVTDAVKQWKYAPGSAETKTNVEFKF
jgi:TonB family protein